MKRGIIFTLALTLLVGLAVAQPIKSYNIKSPTVPDEPIINLTVTLPGDSTIALGDFVRKPELDSALVLLDTLVVRDQRLRLQMLNLIDPLLAKATASQDLIITTRTEVNKLIQDAIENSKKSKKAPKK